MTAETALKDILAELGLDIDTPTVTSTDTDIVQVVTAMNEAGRDLAARFEWSKLFVTTTLAGGLSSSAFPSDFGKLASGVPLRKNVTGNVRPIRRAVTPDEWAMLTARPSATAYFWLENGSIKFAPALETAGAVLRYQSKNWCEAADHVSQNGDNFNIPERLIVSGAVWRYRRQKGFPFDDQMAEHEAQIEEEQRNDRGAQ